MFPTNFHVKQTRRVKLEVKYQPLQCGRWEVPRLNVSGIWLEQAGFQPGDTVEITAGDTSLIIKKLASHGDRHD